MAETRVLQLDEFDQLNHEELAQAVALLYDVLGRRLLVDKWGRPIEIVQVASQATGTAYDT